MNQLVTNTSGDTGRTKLIASGFNHFGRVRLVFGVAMTIQGPNPLRILIETPAFYQNGYLIGRSQLYQIQTDLFFSRSKYQARQDVLKIKKMCLVVI